MYISKNSLDDILFNTYSQLLKKKNTVSATKGKNWEVTGALIKLKNPRARFSRAESREIIWSCLGETLWYFSGSDLLCDIEHYIPTYRQFCELDSVATNAPGAYGPRIFGGDPSQVESIIATLLLPKKHDTRKAVIQIFDAKDLGGADVPCTCTIQFLARGNKLHLFVAMRSNDAFRGLPHDIFAFTMLHEYVANRIKHQLGTYNHAVASLHLYERDETSARKYLAEGLQPYIEMPPMPEDTAEEGMKWLLNAEKAIRTDQPAISTAGINEYWVDLSRLLKIRKSYKASDLKAVVELKNAMHSPVFNAFIRGREVALQKKQEAQMSLPLK